MRLGGISGAGNALVRKLAVEGSWCYAQAGHQPKLMPKGSGVPLEIRMHGRKGSERLLRRREEMLERGMPQAKGERRHRRRAREMAVGPRHDVPGGRRIDIAPVPASRAAFGDTPVLAVRAATAACAKSD